MQGISKKRHENLKNTLLYMEELLSEGRNEGGCLKQAVNYTLELETLYRNYERLLSELSELIIDYEHLYSEVKVQFLGKKLKELKKEIPAEEPAFATLQTSIRLAYGT